MNAFYEWCDRFWWWVNLISLLGGVAVVILTMVYHRELGSPAAWARWTLVGILALILLRLALHPSKKP